MNKKPGYCKISDKNDIRLFKKIVKFIGKVNGKCADISEENIKMEYIKNHFNIEVDQIIAGDLNFDKLTGQYDTIFCFEILEHLQNPLWFMKQLKSILKPRGKIFLSMPGRPSYLWGKYHFHEMMPNHFYKWILAPLGMKYNRKQSFKIVTSALPFYFSGVRPIIRLFYNYSIIYEIQ